MASRTIGRAIVTLTLLGVASAGAQAAPAAPRQLTLAQALDLANRNNPTYQQTLRTTIASENAIRAAYAAFTPSVSSSLGFSYSGAGSTPFAGTVFQESSRLSSNYSIGVSVGLNADKWLAPGQARAQQQVVDENIASSKASMASAITLQYLTTLRAAAGVQVAIDQVDRLTQFLKLAQARQNVGLGTQLDVVAAQVDEGRAENTLLRIRQAESSAKIELLRQIGILAGTDVDSMRLTEAFPLTALVIDLDALRNSARDANPAVRVANAQVEVSRLALKTAKLSYLPSLSLSSGLSGSSQVSTNTDALLANRLASAQGSESSCEFQNALYSRLTSPLPGANGGIVADCAVASGLTSDGTALSPEVAAAVRAGNTGFPFSYKRAPIGLSLGLSLPIWDNLSRSNRISAAQVQDADSRDALRAQEISIDAQVMKSVGDLRTAWESIKIFDLVRQNAAQQLTLAQARYNAGSATALDVQTAQTSMTQAEADYVTSVYDYHTAVVSLETLVGRPLR